MKLVEGNQHNTVNRPQARRQRNFNRTTSSKHEDASHLRMYEKCRLRCTQERSARMRGLANKRELKRDTCMNRHILDTCA